MPVADWVALFQQLTQVDGAGKEESNDSKRDDGYSRYRPWAYEDRRGV